MLEQLLRGDWQKALAQIDFAVMRRVAAWGSATFIALTALIFIADSDTGSKRLQQAFADPSATKPAVAQIPPRQPELERLAERLTETVKHLAADRARLNDRIASLERNFDDVTGSVKKPAAMATDNAGATSQPVPMPMLVFSAMPMLPRGTPALWPDQQSPSPRTVIASAPVISTPQTVQTDAAPVPLPPVSPIRTANVVDDAVDEPPVPPGALGIDLGGARSIDALTIHWATMKVKFGPLLQGLHPVVSIRERKPGVPELRLIAGPLQSPEAVTQTCMAIVAARGPCRPAIFSGQQLTQR